MIPEIVLPRETADGAGAGSSRTEAETRASDAAFPVPDRLLIRCDAPGLLASQAYDVEKFDDGGSACWLGSAGPIELKLPVAPARPFLCKLNVAPLFTGWTSPNCDCT